MCRIKISGSVSLEGSSGMWFTFCLFLCLLVRNLLMQVLRVHFEKQCYFQGTIYHTLFFPWCVKQNRISCLRAYKYVNSLHCGVVYILPGEKLHNIMWKSSPCAKITFNPDYLNKVYSDTLSWGRVEGSVVVSYGIQTANSVIICLDCV